jgi:hypothetical protein
MRPLFCLLFLAVVAGAGCTPNTDWTNATSTTKAPAIHEDGGAATSTDLCTDGPKENEIGSRVFPIATKYARLPHLGQVFTALDCGDRDRAIQVDGFKDGKYVAGVTLSWDDPGPPADLVGFLKKNGFTNVSQGTWKTTGTLTLDQLDGLYWFFSDTSTSGNLGFEDCIRCG